MLTNSHFVKYSTFIITLVILILIYPFGASAGNYFNWNADSLTTSVGVCADFHGTIDTTEKHSGTASMRLDIINQDGQTGCHDNGGKSLGSGADGGWLYYRWWMKISPRFVWGTGQRKMKSNRVKQANDQPPIPYTMYLYSDQVQIGECPACFGGDYYNKVNYDFDPSSNAAVTNWQEYIVGIKKQTCNSCQDAQFHLWVNGVEVGTPIINTRICDSSDCSNWYEAWGSNMVSPYPQLQSPTPAGGTIWLDDFSLDSTWNSIFSSSAPVMAPPAPTGLVLQ
jgi:hypothetical protein